MDERSSGQPYSTDRDSPSQHFSQIPEELKHQRRWVLFELLGNKKKLPKNPRDLNPAKCNDPATWGSFAQCVELFKGGEGDAIGFALNPPYVGIDLDECFEEGDLNTFARELVEAVDSYTETSVSGQGVHITLKGRLARSIKRRGFEIYQTGRFFIYTGNHYPGTPLEILERQAYLDTLPKARTYNGATRGAAEGEVHTEDKITAGERNNCLISLAGSMQRRGMSHAAIEAALLIENKTRCDPKLEEAEVIAIAQSINRYPPASEPTPEVPDWAQESIPIEVYCNGHESDEAPWPEEAMGEGPPEAGEAPIEEALLEIPERLILEAPGVLKSYIEWYLETARNPEPTYALISALGFLTLAVGSRRHLPDTWLNLSLLGIGWTGSGKERILAALSIALESLLAVGRETAAIKVIERGFSSGQAAWWCVHDTGGPVLLFDTELGDLLDAAGKGRTLPQEIMTALIKLHDSVAYSKVVPIKYSTRLKKAQQMRPIDNPFLSVLGTTTPAFYAKARALAGEDGSLNRFLIFNCEATKRPRAGEVMIPFPDEIVAFFRKLKHPRQALTYEPGAQEYQREQEERVLEEIRRAPGTWARFGIKSSRLALAAAVAKDSGVVTEEDMAWGCELVECASRSATLKFEEYGGLACSESDALMKGILAMFRHEAVRKNKGFLTRRILHHSCWQWRKAELGLREKAIAALEKAGMLLPRSKGWIKAK